MRPAQAGVSRERKWQSMVDSVPSASVTCRSELTMTGGLGPQPTVSQRNKPSV